MFVAMIVAVSFACLPQQARSDSKHSPAPRALPAYMTMPNSTPGQLKGHIGTPVPTPAKSSKISQMSKFTSFKMGPDIAMAMHPTANGTEPPRTDQGTYRREAIWYDHDINVCWKMSDSHYTATKHERDLIKSAIASTWESVSSAKFLGWDRCGSSISNGFGIGEEDGSSTNGPHTNALGSQLDGELPGMVFNFEYSNWSPSCKAKLDYCDKLIAIHEFGHALGLAHEQNRADTPKPPKCTQDPQGESGDVNVGYWDLYSVMNYCNPNWNGNGVLSTEDKTTIQQMYGSPAASSKSPVVLDWPSPVQGGSCTYNNMSLRLTSTGNLQFTAFVTPFFPETVSGHLELFKADGSKIESTPQFSQSFTPGGNTLFLETFAYPANDYRKVAKATLSISC